MTGERVKNKNRLIRAVTAMLVAALVLLGDVVAAVYAFLSGDLTLRLAAKLALVEVPLKRFLDEALIPYVQDEVTRLIIDRHDATAFAPINHLTVGDLRDWLLLEKTDSAPY